MIGKRTKTEALNSIIHYLATNRALEVLRTDSLVLRKIIMSWIEDDDLSISKTQIDSLPLFLNISGNESLRSKGEGIIIPPNDTWYKICKRYYADKSIDTRHEANQNLLSKVGSSIPTTKQFFANYLCKDLDSLPQSVCVQFLQEIGAMKESASPWFAPQNKENKDIIRALQTQKLIVFPDGYRCCISEVLDGSDSLLANLLHSNDEKVGTALIYVLYLLIRLAFLRSTSIQRRFVDTNGDETPTRPFAQ